MNAALSDPPRWTPRRWLFCFSLAVLAQLVLLWVLGERPQPLPRPVHFPTSIHLAADPWSAQQLAELPTLPDPAVFALPSLNGFSGSAWLRFAPVEPPALDWTDPPQWLALRPEELGKPFAESVAAEAFPPLLIADKPRPQLIGSEPRVGIEPLPARSELYLEGDLAGRPLVAPPALPAPPHTDVLAPTEVQVLVNPEGDVVSTAVLASCGLKETDQLALKLAAETRFQPSGKEARGLALAEGLTWGKLIFQWHTVAPPAKPAPAADTP